MAFGRLGSVGAGFGRMGSCGVTAIDLLPAPDAPTLTLISGATDATPEFDLTGDLAEGDTVRFQYSQSATFASGVSAITNAIDAAEDAANLLQFATGALADGTWYFRARIERPGHVNSDWSNTESETIDTTAPTIQSVAFTSNAGADGTYKADDVVSVTITWDEAVTVTGTPQLTVNCGGVNKTFDYASGSGATALVFSYTVQAGDNDSNGLSIASNSLALNSGTIKDAAANNATLTHSAAADQAAHKVDTTAPTITSTNTVSNAENTTLAHSLTADETVTWSITGGADQARVELSGSTLRWASNGTKDFEAPDDADTNNTYIVQVTATDAAGNATNQTITVTVTDVDEVAPTASVFSPLDNATGVLVGANLTVQFSENVSFDSTVSITIKKTSDNSTVQAFTEADIGTGISISGDTLTINPTTDLANSTEYYVQIDATSIKDAAGNFYAGISSTTAWSFTTVAGGATFAFVDGAAAGASGGTPPTTSAIDTSGAGLIVAVIATSGLTTGAFGDSKGNTWSELTEASSSINSRIVYCANPNVGSGHTFTVNGGSSPFASIAVAAFSGGAASPFDASTQSSGSSASPSAGSGITPAQNDELVIAAVGTGGGVIDAIDGGFNISDKSDFLDAHHYGAGLAYLIQTSAAAVDPTWTLSASANWSASIACFKFS